MARDTYYQTTSPEPRPTTAKELRTFLDGIDKRPMLEDARTTIDHLADLADDAVILLTKAESTNEAWADAANALRDDVLSDVDGLDDNQARTILSIIDRHLGGLQ